MLLGYHSFQHNAGINEIFLTFLKNKTISFFSRIKNTVYCLLAGRFLVVFYDVVNKS
jgi:hypothetical protein